MKWLVVALLLGHGGIHGMGVAKGLRWAELPELTLPVSRLAAVVWGGALLLLVAAAGLRMADASSWWWVAGLGLLVSQAMITTAWADARYGTLANMLLALAVVHGALSMGPTSYRARYYEVVRTHLAERTVGAVVTEADLAKLPEPAARYLRASGAVGRPSPTLFEAHWRGRIRSNEASPWMTLDAVQVNHTRAPSRHFLMDATLFGLPAQGLHAYVDVEAWMSVKLFSLVPVARASGPEMTKGETVSLLNDMAVLVPSALLQPAVRWEPVDDRSFRVVYSVGSHTVAAVCIIDEAGHLVDFVSDDRGMLQDDGSIEVLRWSTPVEDPVERAGFTVPSRGVARWHPDGGASFNYIELELIDLRVDGEGPALR